MRNATIDVRLLCTNTDVFYYYQMTNSANKNRKQNTLLNGYLSESGRVWNDQILNRTAKLHQRKKNIWDLQHRHITPSITSRSRRVHRNSTNSNITHAYSGTHDAIIFCCRDIEMKRKRCLRDEGIKYGHLNRERARFCFRSEIQSFSRTLALHLFRSDCQVWRIYDAYDYYYYSRLRPVYSNWIKSWSHRIKKNLLHTRFFFFFCSLFFRLVRFTVRTYVWILNNGWFCHARANLSRIS